MGEDMKSFALQLSSLSIGYSIGVHVNQKHVISVN